MAQSKKIRYGAKITIEITGKVPQQKLAELIKGITAAMEAKLENGP